MSPRLNFFTLWKDRRTSDIGLCQGGIGDRGDRISIGDQVVSVESYNERMREKCTSNQSVILKTGE